MKPLRDHAPTAISPTAPAWPSFPLLRPRPVAAALALLLLAPALPAADLAFPDDWPGGVIAGEHGLLSSPGRTFGPRARIRFGWLTPGAGEGGPTFGLSAGDPALPARRAVQLGFRPGPRLAWYDGSTWRELGDLPAATELPIELRLDRQQGRATVTAGAWKAEIPYWNQVGFPDTIYLEPAAAASGALLRRLTLESHPPERLAPRLEIVALGPRTVRLRWSPLEEQAEGFRLYRNGALLATFSRGAYLYTDREVAPRTRYDYRLEAIGAGEAGGALVTPPETDRSPFTGAVDVVVYGATPGGIAAAVTLAQRGHRVALLEPQATIGGMMAGGLGRTDFGSIHALGGLFKQYLAEVSVHYTETYGADSPQAKVMRGGLYFEPNVARMIFERWVAASPNLQLLRQAHLVGVKCVNGRVAAVVIQDRERAVRRTLAARLFVDASYEGDLAAMAGAPYLIGRESREQYGEPHAGELWWNVWERRVVEVVGTGDRKVQAYNYRLCLTRQVDNRLPPPPPRVYDRGRYASLLPDIAAGRLKRLKDIIDILELPGSKADANNHPQGNPSSDLIGGADDYPEANYRQRQAIALEHRDHILGLLWFLRFDPEVPEALRLDAQQWGLARDEFPETESWPSQLYVREGRRLLGEVVFSQRDAMAAPGSERSPIRADSVAVGAYPMDSHATGGRHPQHPELLEGFFYLARGETKPYQIPYAIMLPRGLHNVAMVCCVSSTHIGYGTLRMEPVFMALGLAAAVAGDHALHGGRQLDDLSVARLQWDLLRQGQVLTVFEDVEVGSRGWAALNYLGTRGCFATYLAQPDEALTGTELQGWLAALPWASWRRPVPTAGALTAAELSAVLAALSAVHRLPPPALPDEPVTRRTAAAALEPLLDRWLAAPRAKP